MALRYDLTGTFVECCNCRVICPCWVEDRPTEEFCSGLFAWSFAQGSRIEGRDVSGRHLVAATVHGDSRRGAGSETVLFCDERTDPDAMRDLFTAFAGRGGGPLADLAEVTGDVVEASAARVRVVDDGESPGDSLLVEVSLGAPVIEARMRPQRFDDRAEPLRLTGTALHRELGIGAESVISQRSTRFAVDVAALPGPALELAGRSGMRGPFRYVGGDPVTGEPRSGEGVFGGDGAGPDAVGEAGDDDGGDD